MSESLTLPRPRVVELALAACRAHPREAAAVGLAALAAALALGGAAYSTPTLGGIAAAGPDRSAPPAPPPLIVRQVAPEEAHSINAAIPLATGPNPAARPFALAGASPVARERALECLASAVYYEAGRESADGQRAVAQVVLNRVRHPAFPASVCAVVYEGSTRTTGCQFTFTCDGSLARRPDRAGWDRARRIAAAALAGQVFAPVGHATHYHADYVVPYWAPTLAKNAVIGAHIFYRWAGGWGRPRAFAQRYSGVEASVEALRGAALAAEAKGAAKEAETAALAAIPGAEAVALTPSMRGDKRVAIRFNLAGRKAAEDAPRADYLAEASDTLKWSLTGGIVAADEKPLGRRAPTIGGDGGDRGRGATGGGAMPE